MSGQSNDSRPQAAGPPQQAPLCLADEYMMRIAPGWKPMDETRLNRLLTFIGADTPDKRETVLKGFNASAAEVIQRGGVHIIGEKPKRGDPNVYSIRVPDSELAIRMWEGGMGAYGQFCLDFYDVGRKASVNLPPGHSLHPATATVPAPASAPGGFGQGFVPPVRYTAMNGGPLGPGYPPPGFPMAMNVHAPGFAMAGQLRSWERNMGMRGEIPEGEEKWMVPQGAYVTLRRDGHADVVFQIPTLQPAFAQVALQPRRGAL
ncbi:hypothetical protein C8T65DRAFT_745387 [Cerioporus squamosus]|nr:hypothetical protein C8T65DRAFT_745387 [Cerioporus squamosus]